MSLQYNEHIRGYNFLNSMSPNQSKLVIPRFCIIMGLLQAELSLLSNFIVETVCKAYTHNP